MVNSDYLTLVFHESFFSPVGSCYEESYGKKVGGDTPYHSYRRLSWYPDLCAQKEADDNLHDSPPTTGDHSSTLKKRAIARLSFAKEKAELVRLALSSVCLQS